MREKRSRFVLACQQVLAVGTVVAVAAPAASVVTLDIVAPAPPSVTGAAATPSEARSLVASAPVQPEVSEIPITGVETAGLNALAVRSDPLGSDTSGHLRLASAEQATAGAKLAALTAPERVSGYATVGVTWKHGVVVDENDITVSVRSLTNGSWSGWSEIEYHDDHAPDPGSEEARNARPGTDPLVVGNVDKVQIKAETATGEMPADMTLAVVDPGETTDPVVQTPAIDTAKLPESAATLSSAEAAGTGDPSTADPGTTDPGTIADSALTGNPAEVTPKPTIYSRAQWGADERMRDKSSLNYFEVHAGYVHHTVNANKYTAKQVPSLLRGIYAYHTQSKGWSDIGYNFVVDRFGRIWEGRYGGVARPVVGAHTLGYNEHSFAMSALGNFETARPSAALIDAYARLFAWKLSLHGIAASSTRQRVGTKYFRAINGHRDAGQTACPGKYLYAKLPAIRTLAAGYQKPFTSRAKSTDISGTPWPDLVVRNKTNKRAYLIRTGGQVDYKSRKSAAAGWQRMNLVAAAGDLTGDGVADMVGRTRSTGVTGVYPGTTRGTFGAAAMTTKRFSTMDQITGVLDMNGDQHDDLVARDATSKTLYLFRGNGKGRFHKRLVLATNWSRYDRVLGVGDMTGDGKVDLAARDGKGRLWLVPGNTTRSLGTPVALPFSGRSYDLISGIGDVTNDGRPDIIVRSRKSKLTYIYPGDGHGGVNPRYGAFSQFKAVDFLASVGQLTGNGRSDLVGRVGGRLVVFTNTGNRNIGSVVDTGSLISNTDLLLNVGDWNGDGHGDVMTRSASTGRMYFRAGNGRSRLAAPVQAASGTGWDNTRLVAAVGDVTGDGYPDLMGQPRGGAMRIYPGNGANGFRSSFVAHSAISSNNQVGAGLWNSDGSPDSILRRPDGSLVIYPGNGPGGLMNPRKLGLVARRYDWLQGVGDANGDGRADLIARERSTGVLWLLPRDGSGFAARRFIGVGFKNYDLGG